LAPALPFSTAVGNREPHSYEPEIPCPNFTCKQKRKGRGSLEDFMSSLLVLTQKWVAWYRVLRYGKGFGFVDSLRHGLWLARS
jgi:hypothetical protein